MVLKVTPSTLYVHHTRVSHFYIRTNSEAHAPRNSIAVTVAASSKGHCRSLPTKTAPPVSLRNPYSKKKKKKTKPSQGSRARPARPTPQNDVVPMTPIALVPPPTRQLPPTLPPPPVTQVLPSTRQLPTLPRCREHSRYDFEQPRWKY